MKWMKAPEELVFFITEKMKDAKCDYRKMFGYPAYFVNGNMFIGVFSNKLFLQLSDVDIEKLKDIDKAVTAFEPMPGRVMKGYVGLPKSVYNNDALFAEWLNKSIEFAKRLPTRRKTKHGKK